MQSLSARRSLGRDTCRAALALCVVAGALVLASVAAAQGTRLPAPGRVLYSWVDGATKRSHIFVHGAGYSAPKQVHSQPGLIWRAKWSPDGSMIAFENRGLWVMDADGSHVEQVVKVDGWARPAFTWGPGDRQLTYYKPKARDAGDLWVVDLDSGEQDVLTRGQRVYSAAAWSPDRSRLAYTTGHGAGLLYVMDADGRNVRAVRGAATATDPSWSPDGRRLAFTSYQGMKSNIYVATIDAAGFARQVTDAPYWKETPVWVGGGDWVAYAFSGDVHVVSPEGGRSRALGVQQGDKLIGYFDWFDPSLAVAASGKLPSVWGALKRPDSR